jgi:predicted dehydrogenase
VARPRAAAPLLLLYSKNYQRCHFWFRYQLDYATGEMSDRGAHILDLVQLALNKDDTGPVEFSGTGKRDTSGEFDSFMEYEFRYRYDDGVEVVGTSKGDDSTRGITYHGTKGWIYCHVHGCALKASDPKLLEIKLKPSDETVGFFGEHHQNFYDAIRSRGDTVANAEIGHRSATVCHAATIATLVGKPLTWDPVKEKFTGAGASEANEHLTRKYREPWVL